MALATAVIEELLTIFTGTCVAVQAGGGSPFESLRILRTRGPPGAYPAFDLVHCRALLEHIPKGEFALDQTLGAVKPGGWILIEDCQWDTPLPSEDEAVELSRG